MPADQSSFWRKILSALGLASAGPHDAQERSGAAPGTGHAPDASSFEPGDFVWPKRKGAIVVRGMPAQPAGEEQRNWELQRDRALGQSTRSLRSTPVADRVKSMRYDEFERFYFEGASDDAVTRGIDIAGIKLSVGHVGIIDIDAQGTPFVIEAVPTGSLAVLGGGTVARSPYRDWLARRTDNQVWHGRVKELDRRGRQRIAEEAGQQLGKPYDFFNFDLNDDSSFYCSKLAWMSVWRAASIAIDDDPDPQRGNRFPPWFSPKQMLNARRIVLLRKPDEF